MTREPHKLTDVDRAELCRRVDLLNLLAADGVEVKRRGRAYLCKLRPDERTPSCHVYRPGEGRKGARGWTWHDYGDGRNGDALGYLVDVRGLPFVDAVAELCRLAGWTPPSLQGGAPAAASRPPPTLEPPRLTPDEQRGAALSFVAELRRRCPDAEKQAKAYLAGRGCLPVGTVGAWLLPAEACAPLAAELARGPDADLLTRAGLLKPAEGDKPTRLAWWDRTCLLGCYDAEGCLVYFVGRRLDWKDGDPWGKYINQGTAGGAVRVPYNLPALYQAAGRLDGWPVQPAREKAGDVLLVEGPLDALGAAVLGWPAVALLTRLQAHDYADRDGAAARALDVHLPALRDVRRVRVVPDADPGSKGAEGEALAARLVGWLRNAGVRAELATLADLCPDAADCKDLADVAKAKGRPT
jgi:DNA primase